MIKAAGKQSYDQAGPVIVVEPRTYNADELEIRKYHRRVEAQRVAGTPDSPYMREMPGDQKAKSDPLTFRVHPTDMAKRIKQRRQGR